MHENFLRLLYSVSEVMCLLAQEITGEAKEWFDPMYTSIEEDLTIEAESKAFLLETLTEAYELIRQYKISSAAIKLHHVQDFLWTKVLPSSDSENNAS